MGASRAEASAAAFGGIELEHFPNNDTGDGRDDELGHAHAVRDDHRLGPEVDKRDLDLSTVVGVDRSNSVYGRQTVLGAQARTGPHLSFVSRGDCDREPGRHAHDRSGQNLKRELAAVKARREIQARSTRGFVLGDQRVGSEFIDEERGRVHERA